MKQNYILANEDMKLMDLLRNHHYNSGSVIPFNILNQALEYNRLDLAMNLLDIYTVDNLNDSVYPTITAAARYGNSEIFEKLISLGANINAITHLKSSAVEGALGSKNYQAIYDLLELGFDMKSFNGGIALRVAAWSGEFKFVRLFVKYGANVNFNGADQVFPNCSTPVQVAAFSNHVEIVKFLVKNGADVTIKDKNGYRAYLEAKKNKNEELMQYIRPLEPIIWRQSEKRIEELKRWGLPTEIAKWLGTENKRIDLSESCPSDYIEFETIFDVRIFEWQDEVFIDLVKEIDSYSNSGFIVWVKNKKCLGSLDIEHDNLITFKRIKWNKFIKNLPLSVKHILEGTQIDELNS